MAKEPINTTTSPLEDIQAQIARIQLKKLLEQEQQEADDLAQRKAVQLASVKSLKEQREREIMNQNLCSHKKINGQTKVVGTRDSNVREIFLCQGCNKEYTAANIPPELRPHPNVVGGPIIGVAI